MKNAKFEVYKDKAGEFRFRLKAKNGENILQSEGYACRQIEYMTLPFMDKAD
ncbi:MAG: DUF1508 domain-containing protein [Bacteroidota bacterium]